MPRLQSIAACYYGIHSESRRMYTRRNFIFPVRQNIVFIGVRPCVSVVRLSVRAMTEKLLTRSQCNKVEMCVTAMMVSGSDI